MSGYAEGLWPEDYCYIEGHIFRDGGACVRCGERLRCYVCGQYMTLSEKDIEKHVHIPCSATCEGCDECLVGLVDGGGAK